MELKFFAYCLFTLKGLIPLRKRLKKSLNGMMVAFIILIMFPSVCRANKTGGGDAWSFLQIAEGARAIGLGGAFGELVRLGRFDDTEKAVMLSYANAIEGVEVKVKDAQGRSLVGRTTTGEDGHFKIDNLDKKSKYLLTFTANNYIIPPDKIYNLKELSKDEATNLKINLEATTGIEGIVLDNKTNKPIEGANVMPRLLDNQGNLSDALAIAQFTDNQGRFRTSYLRPGKYRLLINHENYKATYYPKEGAHELKMGENWRDITILLEEPIDVPPLGPPTGIEGDVKDEKGKPVSGVEVTLSEDDQFIRKTTTDSKGEFKIEPLKPGKYRLRIEYNYKENGKDKSVKQYQPKKDSPAYELRKEETWRIKFRLPVNLKNIKPPPGPGEPPLRK